MTAKNRNIMTMEKNGNIMTNYKNTLSEEIAKNLEAVIKSHKS